MRSVTQAAYGPIKVGRTGLFAICATVSKYLLGSNPLSEVSHSESPREDRRGIVFSSKKCGPASQDHIPHSMVDRAAFSLS